MMDNGKHNRTAPADLTKLKRISVHERTTIAPADHAAKLPEVGAAMGEFLDSLPDSLAAKQLRLLADAIAKARAAGLPVIFGMGGHVVKVGCSPIIIDLMRRGVITHLAMNGSVAIHDYEMAALGTTSEDVGATLHTGMYAMVRETAEALAIGADAGAESEIGFGAAMGRHIAHSTYPNIAGSILATAYKHARAATVHVGLGCDTVHMHPEADGAAIGKASHIDFRILISALCEMHSDDEAAGGVYVNCGSAVFMPEVFLKAFNVARNLGANLDSITTANLDMIQHYRPRVNVTGRPAAAGKGLSITGHHEIMLPLLRMAILNAMG